MAVWTVYLSLCLLIALTASEEANPVGNERCSGWYVFGCRCFKFFNNLQTWTEAEKTCSYYDGNLASVHSYEEYVFLQNLIRATTHATTRTWIGGNDRVQEGDWRWTDGTKMNYKIWLSTEPDNYYLYGGEHCLEMNFYGRWNDIPCSRMKPFVCVKKNRV